MGAVQGPGETRYAYNGEVAIAWQAIGDGPLDVLFIPGFISHVEHWWELPATERFMDRLASFSRLILFDKRGTGMSDPVERAATLEERMDDARAVLDAAASQRAAVLGLSEGGALAVLLAATHPQRVQSLILMGSSARLAWDEDWPWGWPPAFVDTVRAGLQRWGEDPFVELWARSIAGDERARRSVGRLERMAASPAMARRLFELAIEVDVRDVARAVSQPTLVVHADGERTLTVEHARHTAALIPGAQLVTVSSRDHFPWTEGAGEMLDAVETFLTGGHEPAAPDTVLATVLFSDVVDSTRRAAELGDRRWRELLEDLDRTVERQVGRFRGRTVKQLGDGHLSAFDGPARAVRCATALVQSAQSLDLHVRCGIHTGECEVRSDDLAGLAVHIGARVGSLAGPGEVLVSGTVKDLVAGSGLEFAARGAHELKGVPGEWPLYAVASSASSS